MFLLSGALAVNAQTATTQALQEKYGNSLSLYFYKNTLRMLNQTENKDFDDAIKEIEKLKFLLIDKSDGFQPAEFKQLVNDYKSESYEEIMTSRYKGKNLDVYLKEKNNITKGMVVLVNDSSTLYVLDLIGRVPVDKITKLFAAIDENADIGKKIQSFTNHMDRDEERSKRDN